MKQINDMKKIDLTLIVLFILYLGKTTVNNVFPYVWVDNKILVVSMSILLILCFYEKNK